MNADTHHRNLEVRPALPGEYPVIGELTVAAFEGLGRSLGDYANALRDVDRWAASADVLVAVDAGRIVGAATYVPGPGSAAAEFDDPDAAGIRFLAVAPEAQGRGVGQRLLEACVERARQRRRARVLLHTTTYMQEAQQMYERAGFVRDPARDWTVERGVELLGYRLELGGPAGQAGAVPS